MTFRTSHVYPPIPDRRWDWCAWYDDVGEEGPTGWGPSEAAAIDDLITEHPRED